MPPLLEKLRFPSGCQAPIGVGVLNPDITRDVAHDRFPIAGEKSWNHARRSEARNDVAGFGPGWVPEKDFPGQAPVDAHGDGALFFASLRRRAGSRYAHALEKSPAAEQDRAPVDFPFGAPARDRTSFVPVRNLDVPLPRFFH